MSQEDVEELVRRFGRANNPFMRNEVSSETLAGLFDPEMEVPWPGQRAHPHGPQPLRGIPEFIEFAEQYRSAWDHLAHEPLELIEVSDDRVLVSIRQSGRGRESGVPIVIHFLELFTIRHGKLRKVEYFRHRADALEAAGLRE